MSLACGWSRQANLSLSRHGSYHGISQTIHHISSYLSVFVDLVIESMLPDRPFSFWFPGFRLKNSACLVLLKKHMWNITGSGHYTLLSAIWPGEGPVWEEVLWETTPCLCLLHHAGPEPCHITACTTAVTVCIFDILTDAEKEQVLRISATILFYPPLEKKSGLWSTELSECIIVIYCNLTLLQSITFTVFLRKRKRHRKGKWINVVQVDWPQRQIRNMGMSLNIDPFFFPAVSSL